MVLVKATVDSEAGMMASTELIMTPELAEQEERLRESVQPHYRVIV